MQTNEWDAQNEFHGIREGIDRNIANMDKSGWGPAVRRGVAPAMATCPNRTKEVTGMSDEDAAAAGVRAALFEGRLHIIPALFEGRFNLRLFSKGD